MPLEGGPLSDYAISFVNEGLIQPAGSETPGPFVPNAVNMLEGFGSPEVGREVDFGACRAVCQ
jgi:hypothetical protein